eukprot:GFUD01047003.1.p1 GENE.GFUD01047003.1~~GFUD01047003.1.p1  ORF type:complete len:149 (+),score=19.26 GFUD01047003.1:119-565(+)
MQTLMLTWLVFLVNMLEVGWATINCYSCTSRNHSDLHCEDPMSPYHSEYTINCQVPKEGHLGQFPANFCVKLTGVSAVTGESLVSRTCVLEDMNSQCGLFKFQNDTMNGCILTCEHDGCNSALTVGCSGCGGWMLGAGLLLTFSRISL